MASYKEILEEKNRQFRALKQEEKEELAGVERILHGQVLEAARAQIRANFADRRRYLREDPVYKAALLLNFNSNLFHLDENDGMREEPKPYQEQEKPKPEDNEENEKQIGIVCSNCGETYHEPGAKFCHVCGNKFNTDESNQERKEEEQKKSSRNRRRKKGKKKNKKENNL